MKRSRGVCLAPSQVRIQSKPTYYLLIALPLRNERQNRRSKPGSLLPGQKHLPFPLAAAAVREDPLQTLCESQ